MVRPPVAEQVQVNFRMPVDLRDRIKAAAEKSGRSMNAEITQALELSYPQAGSPENELKSNEITLRLLINGSENSPLEDDILKALSEYFKNKMNRLASASREKSTATKPPRTSE